MGRSGWEVAKKTGEEWCHRSPGRESFKNNGVVNIVSHCRMVYREKYRVSMELGDMRVVGDTGQMRNGSGNQIF